MSATRTAGRGEAAKRIDGYTLVETIQLVGEAFRAGWPLARIVATYPVTYEGALLIRKAVELKATLPLECECGKPYRHRGRCRGDFYGTKAYELVRANPLPWERR